MYTKYHQFPRKSNPMCCMPSATRYTETPQNERERERYAVCVFAPKLDLCLLRAFAVYYVVGPFGSPTPSSQTRPKLDKDIAKVVVRL